MLVRLLHGMVESLFPLGRQITDRLIDHLWRAERHIELLQTAKANTLHPVQVRGDSIPSDVAIQCHQVWGRALSGG